MVFAILTLSLTTLSCTSLQESKYASSAPFDLIVSTISIPLEVIAFNFALSLLCTLEMLTLTLEMYRDKKILITIVATQELLEMLVMLTVIRHQKVREHKTTLQTLLTQKIVPRIQLVKT